MLSNSGEENDINTVNIVETQKKKKKLVKKRKNVVKTENYNRKVQQNKRLRKNVFSSSFDSDVEMSYHSNSDLMGVDIMPTDEEMYNSNLQPEFDDTNDTNTKAIKANAQLLSSADNDKLINGNNSNNI